MPHWYQPGVTYFVTFRTEDSLPKEVADLWFRRRSDWLARIGIDVTLPGWKQRLRKLAERQQHEFHNMQSREFLCHLDKGHGACVLRRRELAKIVAESLWHFDSQRYDLGDFVVMPNHVHLLDGLLVDTDIEQQCYSWKKFMATQINRVLHQKGRFWVLARRELRPPRTQPGAVRVFLPLHCHQRPIGRASRGDHDVSAGSEGVRVDPLQR